LALSRYVLEYDEPLDNWAKAPSAFALVVMLLIACGRVGTGPASSITIVALGFSLGSGGQPSPSIERSHVRQAR
jgi:hypothetical protein